MQRVIEVIVFTHLMAVWGGRERKNGLSVGLMVGISKCFRAYLKTGCQSWLRLEMMMAEGVFEKVNEWTKRRVFPRVNSIFCPHMEFNESTQINVSKLGN